MKCSICEGPVDGYGHNPDPVIPDYDKRCCSICNDTVVIPVRLFGLGNPGVLAAPKRVGFGVTIKPPKKSPSKRRVS